jgi:hypothetical protein
MATVRSRARGRRAMGMGAMLVLSVAACSTDGEVLTSLPPREPIVPRAASDFLDSIDVTLQPVRFAPSFEDAVMRGLAALGVRHVRQWASVPGSRAAADAEIVALSTLQHGAVGTVGRELQRTAPRARGRCGREAQARPQTALARQLPERASTARSAAARSEAVASR